MFSQKRKCSVQLTHEYLATSSLIILISVKSRLNIEVSLKKEDEAGHGRELSTRSLTASHVVNSVGCCRKCSVRRSSSAMISRETGTSDGFASRSFHNSET